MSLPKRARVVAANVRRLRRALSGFREAPQAFPPGAFYSSVPNARELLGPERDRLWHDTARDMAGVDIAATRQFQLLETLDPWPDASRSRPTAGYDAANDQFPPQDATLLYAMVAKLRPSRVVEVGCGWSTTVISQAIRDGSLDTELTCIEPYPREFLSSIPEIDRLRQERVEHVEIDQFTDLSRGDVLFIDTSHVVKTGSDVVHLLLEVVPRLAVGVVVHVHDVFLPFEYPPGWVEVGFGWNEQYLLQAYFSGNDSVHILAMNHWLARSHPEKLRAAGFPDRGGSSVWFAVGEIPTVLCPDQPDTSIQSSEAR